MIEEPMALANTIRQRYELKQREEEAEKRRKEEEEKEKAQKAKTNKNRKKLKPKKLDKPVYSKGVWCSYSPSIRADWHFRRGCIKPLKNWLNSSTDLLFVIGFCVIAFLKFVFLSILHYEIREMIQKIHMLENETNQMNGGLAAALGLGPEICSISSSADHHESSTPSCHSSQYCPPQTANTILSYPTTTAKSATYNVPNPDKTTPVAVPNAIGSIAHNSVEELIDTKTSLEMTNSNFIPMTTVSTNQLVNTDTYPCHPLLPPPKKAIRSPGKEDPGVVNLNPHPNRTLNLNTELTSGTSIPHSHDLITSSTATTAQSSSESAINKQGEFLNRSSEASILSPQSEGWPLGSTTNYFQNSSDVYSGVFDGTTIRGEKPASEYHELSNKQISTKCDASMQAQSQGFMDIDKHIVRHSHRHHNEGRNIIPTTSDCTYGGSTSVSYCANPNALFMETECIAEGSGVRSGSGGSSKQTAI